MSDDGFLTTEEVLQYLQLNLKTVYRLIRAGKLPAVRVGRQWRFRKRDIDAWLATTALPPGSPSPASARILVVDDDEAARGVIAATLADSAQYRVEVAADGPSALSRLEANSYDLVLTDLKMPLMDGLTFIEELRRRAPELPVVVLTAASTESAAIAAANLHVAGYLLKPYEWPRILDVVARALREKRSARA